VDRRLLMSRQSFFSLASLHNPIRKILPVQEEKSFFDHLEDSLSEMERIRSEWGSEMGVDKKKELCERMNKEVESFDVALNDPPIGTVEGSRKVQKCRKDLRRFRRALLKMSKDVNRASHQHQEKNLDAITNAIRGIDAAQKISDRAYSDLLEQGDKIGRNGGAATSNFGNCILM